MGLFDFFKSFNKNLNETSIAENNDTDFIDDDNLDDIVDASWCGYAMKY